MAFPPFRALLVAGATITGGVFALSLASSVTLRVVRSTLEAKTRKSSKPCQVCKGKGAYSCKLCKCNGTIEWSPLFDPIAINPCYCPSCEGCCIQKCLNCTELLYLSKLDFNRVLLAMFSFHCITYNITVYHCKQILQLISNSLWTT